LATTASAVVVVGGGQRPTIRRLSEVAFLVGKQVREIRYGHGIRIVFDPGDRVEPALYADVGRSAVLERIRTPVRTRQAVRAWQVVGGTPQALVVCLGGGELAVWEV
jgi:hypothetical protein